MDEGKLKKLLEEKTMPRVMQQMLIYKGMPFLPHYSLPDTYVAPGGAVHSGEYLLHLGATIYERELWPRE